MSLLNRFAAGVLGAACLLGAGACGKAGETADGDNVAANGPGEALRIGLLLPENKTARYEAFDRPLIEQDVKALCPQCTVLYQNAQQDAARQQVQADSLLSQGIHALILDAVDAKAAGGIVARAKEQGVPVVAYDRFASGPVDYFVTFDNEKVGQEQGKALIEALRRGGDLKRGPIVMINGSATDPNAADFKRGAHSVLDGQVEIGFETDTPDWSPDKAQQEVEQALTKLGAHRVIGIYAANDGMASGAIAALKGQGVEPLPPVTGQDAELAGIQRILAGDQHMTIYKPYVSEARTAAAMAVAAARRQPYADPTVELTNASGDKVPSVLLPVVVVTRDNVKTTVLADGIYSLAQICAEPFAAACKEAGLE
ncbi:MAG TPA: substrate-binding domain-containing protein [Thermoanaerobaculia bacterium]|nr:substrate-binding domain-containing protein [Thermoanaerobaculia bacterium]